MKIYIRFDKSINADMQNQNLDNGNSIVVINPLKVSAATLNDVLPEWFDKADIDVDWSTLRPGVVPY